MRDAVLACAIAWLALAAAGCAGERVSISVDETLGGSVGAGRFELLPGATITLAGDLTIDSRGHVHIDGDIEPAAGLPASLYIQSREGNIYIDGRVRAGNGAAKGLVEAPARAVAESGGPGGSISLIAPRGSVFVRGSLESGSGGQGGFAQATGGAALIFAEGGSGGPGGKILIRAGDLVDVTNGTIRGGTGGSGGWAVAQLPNVPEIDTNVAVGTDITPENLELLALALQALRRSERTRTRAVAGAGGTGGDIEIGLAGSGREVLLQGTIESGIGGNGGEAKARLGHAATAVAQRGGRGGRIDLNAGPVQLFTLIAPAPGRGRDGGRAVAFAVNTALAAGGAGGDAGIVLEQGAKTAAAAAGDGAAAIVQTFDPALRRAEGRRLHAGDVPGGAVQVTIP